MEKNNKRGTKMKKGSKKEGGLDAVINLRCSKETKKEVQKRGGAWWLRRMIEKLIKEEN
jgi:hypothetical protein